jgi:hypothetical protein
MPHPLQDTEARREVEQVSRLRRLLDRIFRRAEHDRASDHADEEEFVRSGVDALPDSWRDL